MYELCTDLKQDGIPFKVMTDTGFAPKLRDMGIEPDHIVDVKLSDPPQSIMKKFHNTVKGIDYGFMVKIGARMTGPNASRKLGKPYIITDGGLPDYMTEEEGLYSRKTFQGAERYYVTTQFDWTPPKRLELDNVDVCCYPVSKKTFKRALSLAGRWPDSLHIAVMWLSGLPSGLVDNIPLTATFAPILSSWVLGGVSPDVWWGLVVGANLGGTLTSIGSPSNIIVLGVSEREGHPISMGRFFQDLFRGHHGSPPGFDDLPVHHVQHRTRLVSQTLSARVQRILNVKRP